MKLISAISIFALSFRSSSASGIAAEIDKSICQSFLKHFNECPTTTTGDCANHDNKATQRYILCKACDNNDYNDFDFSLNAEDRANHCNTELTMKAPDDGQKDAAWDRSALCQNGICKVKMDISGIWQYGCWCNFDDPIDGQKLMSGSGTPVDDRDELCRSYQLCLRCVRRDANDGGYSCDPHTDTYNALAQGMSIDCVGGNGGSACGEHLCMCNQAFISRITTIAWNSIQAINPAYWQQSQKHPTGTFDEQACYSDQGSQDMDMECCGGYANRFPYDIKVRSCCMKNGTGHGEIYHPQMSKCCTDSGEVKGLADAC